MALPSAKIWLPVALTVSYALFSHLATIVASRDLQWLALLAVAATPMCSALLRGRPGFWLLFLLLALALWWLVHAGGGQYALYLPPVLLPLVLAACFAHTLRPGRTALISSIASAARGSLAPAIAIYTRRLTLFWALFLTALAGVALLLSVTGPLWLWSLFTNFVSYALIGVVFVVEYLLRRHWFREHPHYGFFTYLGIVIRSTPRSGAGR